MTDIVLASQSPRRQDLLKQVGINFRVITSSCDESYADGLGPKEIVAQLSSRKADNVFDKVLSEDSDSTSDKIAVIAADTIVALDNEILGKPKDRADAFRMLKALSGRSHSVYTGVTIIYATLGKVTAESFVSQAEVKFFDLTDDEIDAYISTWEPMDKAGAYGIQEKGAALVESIAGDYYTIVGLPVAKVYRSLKTNRFI